MGWFYDFLRWLGTSQAVSESSSSTEVYDFRSAKIKAAGTVDGKHYSQFVERVKQLKREKRHKEAVTLLLRLVDATESEARAGGRGWGVAPWYYEQLAIIYRKEKDYEAEAAIYKRYRKHCPRASKKKDRA